MNPDVSKESGFFRTSITAQLTAKRHIPEQLNNQICRCDYLDYSKIFFFVCKKYVFTITCTVILNE